MTNTSTAATPPGAATPLGTADAFWLCEVTNDPVQTDACFACARQRLQTGCHFTPAVLRALRTSMQPDPALQAVYALARQAGVTVLRVSSLTGCTRQAWYKTVQATPLEKPSRHWARLRGSIFHEALQAMAGKDAIAERRFVVSLQAHGLAAWIAGQVDHYDPQTGVIVDYKTINANGRKLHRMEDLPQEHHRAQVWIYAWLLEQSGWPYPQAARIVYMDMGDVRLTEVPMPSAEGRQLVAQRIIAKAKTIVEAGDLGPKGDPRMAWECRYCLYKPTCPDRDTAANGNGEKG